MTFSITEYASDKQRMAFVCTCKKCANGMSDYVSPQVWLDIAFVLQDKDELTNVEFKKLNHSAVSQWNTISKLIK